jgi:opacity protein-like surface antigen
MRNLLTAAAVASAAVASPAFADGPYVGIEGGVTLPRSTDLDIILNNTSVTPNTSVTYSDGERAKFKTGWNADVLAGYKLGLVKLEVQGGYQRANLKSLTASTTLLNDVSTATDSTVTSSDFPGGRAGVTYALANVLLDGDFGGGFGGYIGGGAGRAWVSYSGDKDNAWAFDGTAGLRYALTPNLDAGLKYQYLRTAKVNFDDAFAVDGVNYTSTARGNYASHNVLASLVYNFNGREATEPAAPPPPPPPPPPPATQTCPDGSVIEATANCPAPPPPPPPPPATKGERG